MAYGVDKYPDPPELPSYHYDYDRDDNGDIIETVVYNSDEDELEEEDDA